MKIIPAQYIADDGTIFAEECECEAYETELKIGKAMQSNEIAFYDEKGEPTTFERAIFIAIHSAEGYNALRIVSNYHGMSIPQIGKDEVFTAEGRLFKYNGHFDEWIDYAAELRAKINLYNTMMGA